jgi:fatty acid desaturase
MTIQILKDMREGTKFILSKKNGLDIVPATVFIAVGVTVAGVAGLGTAAGAWPLAPFIPIGLALVAIPVVGEAASIRGEREEEAKRAALSSSLKRRYARDWCPQFWRARQSASDPS